MRYAAGNVIISLLRAKGIPARHVVSLNVSGDRRLWYEFYLEKCGWIPFSIKPMPMYFADDSFFVLAVASLNWNDRQLYSVVYGYSIASKLKSGANAKEVTNHMLGSEIVVTGAMGKLSSISINRVE